MAAAPSLATACVTCVALRAVAACAASLTLTHPAPISNIRPSLVLYQEAHSHMLKKNQIQRLTFLFAIAGLFALSADFACLEDVCAESTSAEFRTWDAVKARQIETLDQGIIRSGIALTDVQKARLAKEGKLAGVVNLDRPVKHPNGFVEMPRNWLPEIAPNHPWRNKLTPADDAFYSFVEERIIKARLFDPKNPEHLSAVEAYLNKARSKNPEFIRWTYAGNRTECEKKKLDAFAPPATDAM